MMNDADIIAAIRAKHLKANIHCFEEDGLSTIHWDRAFVDSGGTIFGPGPYVKVPVTVREVGGPLYEIVVRVYPSARLRRQLARKWKPDGSSAVAITL